MERPAGLNPKIAGGIIILFHLVGIIGLALPAARPVFLKLVPYHLMLMFVVLLLSNNVINQKYLLFVFLIYVLGFGLEWIGVHRNWIFGEYAYGETLGIKLWGIPLAIGINWFMLVYATGVTMQYTRIKNTWVRIFLGAATLVLLDLLIEPVAIKFGYWHWVNHVIPLKNYIGWFAAGVFILGVFEYFNFGRQSRVAMLFLGVQFMFFGLLNLF